MTKKDKTSKTHLLMPVAFLMQRYKSSILNEGFRIVFLTSLTSQRPPPPPKKKENSNKNFFKNYFLCFNHTFGIKTVFSKQEYQIYPL